MKHKTYMDLPGATFSRVRTHRFEVLDDTGETRAEITVAHRSVIFSLFDSRGITRARVTVSAEGEVDILTGKEGGEATI